MAHKLEIRARGKRVAAGIDAEVLLDGKLLEWTRVELVLDPDDAVTVHLRLLLNELRVDLDVLVSLQAMADARTKVVLTDSRAD